MTPSPQKPEPSQDLAIVVLDRGHVVYADFLTPAQLREIVQIIQKHKPLLS